ncbi:hypothetical protein DRH14_04405 [Candidatus Shapirobacteria bacterium]|nr:MAG: hypothetical protein DRH14_04405 [Candidatus Shapirobacteria bacterium]
MKNKFPKDKILEIGKDVLMSATEGIAYTRANLGISFVKAVNLIININGKIIFSGMGKSGIIARKLASTMSSTGTFSCYIHPVEALHGDLGMIKKHDILIIISNSGETPEIITFLKHVKDLNLDNEIIAITSQKNSKICQYVDIKLFTHISRETRKKDSQLYYVPTTSTTVAMALGDALISACRLTKGFELTSFLKYHPEGHIGKLLKTKIG